MFVFVKGVNESHFDDANKMSYSVTKKVFYQSKDVQIGQGCFFPDTFRNMKTQLMRLQGCWMCVVILL